MQFPTARQGLPSNAAASEMTVGGLTLGPPRLPIAFARASAVMSETRDVPPRPNYGALSVIVMEYVDIGASYEKFPGEILFADTQAPTPFTGPASRYLACFLSIHQVIDEIRTKKISPADANKRFRYVGVLKELTSYGKRGRDSERVSVIVNGLADTYDDVSAQELPIGSAIFAVFKEGPDAGVEIRLDFSGRDEKTSQFIGVVTRCCTTGVRPMRTRPRKQGGFRDLSILV